MFRIDGKGWAGSSERNSLLPPALRPMPWHKDWAWLKLLAIVFVCLSILAVVIGASSARAKDMSMVDVTQHLMDATVEIGDPEVPQTVMNPIGSGFLVSPQHILTAGHVTSWFDDRWMNVTFPDGTVVRGEKVFGVYAEPGKGDWSLVKLERSVDVAPVKLSCFRPYPRTDILISGLVASTAFVLYEAKIMAGTLREEISVEHPMFIFGTGWTGSSGSLVANMEGEAIGIVTHVAYEVSNTIPIQLPLSMILAQPIVDICEELKSFLAQ